jgi:hypothetical protein
MSNSSTSSSSITLSPSRQRTAKEAKAILAKRKTGLYESADTRDEAIVSVYQLKTTPGEKMVSLFHHTGQFSICNQREALTQIKLWQNSKAVLRPANIWEIDCEEVGKATLFIIQPADMTDCPISPLALGFHKMVNGYGFITHDRSFVDMILTALNPTPKPTPTPTPMPTPTPKPKPVLNYVEVAPVDPRPVLNYVEVCPVDPKPELNYVEVCPVDPEATAPASNSSSSSTKEKKEEEKRFDIRTTMVSGIVCRRCGNELPLMTAEAHLEGWFNQTCPHKWTPS